MVQRLPFRNARPGLVGKIVTVEFDFQRLTSPRRIQSGGEDTKQRFPNQKLGNPNSRCAAIDRDKRRNGQQKSDCFTCCPTCGGRLRTRDGRSHCTCAKDAPHA